MSDIRLFQIPEHECSYLTDQLASTVFVDPELPISPALLSDLSRIGFRRSGEHVYRPHCPSCSACIPTRIIAPQFTPSRSQARTRSKNQDLSMEILQPLGTDEIYALYARYISARHQDGDMYPPSREQFDSFLLGDIPTQHFLAFRLHHKLVAIMVADKLDDGWSAVYSFFEPDLAARSLGTFMILRLIELSQQRALPYVYLGYYIKDCGKMNYKLNFLPCQQYRDRRWTVSQAS